MDKKIDENKRWTVKLKRDILGYSTASCNGQTIPQGTVLTIQADYIRKAYLGRHQNLGFTCTREDFDVIE